ncbi:alpha/beta hydrolase family protein [Dokdonella sp. MW10]|uniref:alpha/beta hydrolase family protein n=1 Tax=Dokdonella sp. MW10 TaxID=2992926 RepID=UPI003F7E5C93
MRSEQHAPQGGSWHGKGMLALARVVMIVVLLVPGLAFAMKRVDPGDTPKVGPKQGLVLIAVDSSMPLSAVHVRKGGRLFGAGVLTRLPEGRTLRLYVADEGRYGWHKVNVFSGFGYGLEDDEEFQFEVKPGQITYAGDLLYRPLGFFRARIHVSNRGLAALDWLQAEHAALLEQYPFAYTGHYPDPFPAFYQRERAAADVKPPPYPEFTPPPEPGTLPLPPGELWRDERVSLIELSPSGELLALQTKEDGKDAWVLDLLDLAHDTSYRVARSDYPFQSVSWASDRTLLAALGRSSLPQWINVVTISEARDGRRTFERGEIPQAGRIVDVLAHDPNHILFASYGNRGEFMVHRVDVSSAAALKKFQPRMKDRLNAGTKDDVWWYADGQGALRVAIVRRDDEPVLMLAGPEGFTEIMRLRGDSGFSPMSLSYDGRTIYGLSDEGRAQQELVAFDIASRKVTETLFSKPGVDVVTPIYDRQRRPIGARYYLEGRLVSEYFERHEREFSGLLERSFPGRTVAVVERSTNGKQIVLWVDGSDQPATLYHLDVDKKRATLVEETMPWLAGRAFAPTVVVNSKGKDGLAIESYLTTPRGPGPHPLVVLAHGGPVGIKDTLHFERDVQFIASLGYAVLRVNFRGSGGYGKAFREAGYHNHGTLIEDDIDAALTRVLAEHPIDASRMCAIGFSYGGYSSLVSAVRWPDRYRCVVSTAGVSDRLLFFTASDGGRSKEGRAALEKVVGDPKTQEAQMIETSPLYRYRDLRVPVMLLHGDEDLRVDFEHARRLKRMLDMAGRSPVGRVFAGEGHGLGDKDHQHQMWRAIAGFLQQHLGATPATSAPVKAAAP